MSLSIEKLQNFLFSKGFATTKFFIYDSSCYYIEILNIKTSDVFLMYIPSKYNFVVGGDDCYKVKEINMEMEDDIANDYVDKKNIRYKKIKINNTDDNMEQHLEKNYKHTISLKDIAEVDLPSLRSIYRQIKRLYYSVENIDYKVGIMFKNYLCCVQRSGDIICFAIKNHPRLENKKIFIIPDMEMVYEKIEVLSDEMSLVKESIYKVLSENQFINSEVVQELITSQDNIMSLSETVFNKLVNYNNIIADLEKMLNILNEKEEKITEEINIIAGQNTNFISSDISRVHKKALLEKERSNINSLQESVANNMMHARNKKENLIVSVDALMFDNAVMLNSILKNFKSLSEICK